jgi:hypothetical protein
MIVSGLCYKHSRLLLAIFTLSLHKKILSFTSAGRCFATNTDTVRAEHSRLHTQNKVLVLFQAKAQLTVNTRTLLVPPLVQPTSPEFPLGVSTLTFTVPGPEITSLESFTFNC